MIVVYVIHESSSSSSTVSAAQRWCTVIPLLLFATWKWHTRVSILDNRTEESFDGESLFFFSFSYFSFFPIHSAEHSSITSDVVATSIRNMDKNSTSTQITRQLSNWSRANSFQLERNIRDTLYRGSATIRASPVVVRRPRELGTRIVDPNPRVVDLARTITRFQTPSKSKAWNCFADLASPVSDTSFDTRASRPTTVKHSGKEHLRKESGRRRATLPFHALETTIWNYVNIETCSQFD